VIFHPLSTYRSGVFLPSHPRLDLPSYGLLILSDVLNFVDHVGKKILVEVDKSAGIAPVDTQWRWAWVGTLRRIYDIQGREVVRQGHINLEWAVPDQDRVYEGNICGLNPHARCGRAKEMYEYRQQVQHLD